MLGLIAMHFNAEKESALSAMGKITLQRKALFAADSLVKNRDNENPALGAAILDTQKHRVMSNEIDIALLRKAKAINGGGFAIKEISLEFKGGEKEIIFSEPGAAPGDCIAVERAVLAEEKKAVVRMVACEG